MARVARTKAAEPAPKKEKTELEQVMSEILKRYGEGTLVNGREVIQPWRIPTDIFMLDLALLGGIPHNRISMFHGPRSSGKTTGANKAIAGAQSSMVGMTAAVVDVEGTYDTTWAEKCGVDIDALIVAKPSTGEQAVDITDALIRTREISLVVVDSLAALAPMKEIEGSAEDLFVGLQSRLIGSMIRKTVSALIDERKRGHFVTVLYINQQRSKIGGWAPPGQEALSLPGGKALEYATTVQCKFKNKESITKDDIGLDTIEFNEHSFTIDKNKMHGGIRTGDYRLMRRDSTEFNLIEGSIDNAPTMLAHAKKVGCYTGGGKSWTLSIPDFEGTLGNADEWIGYLYENPDVMWNLRKHLIADHAVRLKMPQYFIDYLYS